MKLSVAKIQQAVIIFLRLTLVVAAIGAALQARWSILFVSVLICFFTFLPHFLENKYHFNLPLEFEFIIIIFIYASLFMGDVHSYYSTFWWWDVLLHSSAGLALAFAGFLFLYGLYVDKKLKAKPIWIAIFTFCFGMALGAVWEIFEFCMDYFFGLNMQKSGLIDTMGDLIVDALASFIIAFVSYFYVCGKKVPIFTRFLRKFEKENPEYFK